MNPVPDVTLLIVMVVILVAALIFTTLRKRRSERPRERVGPQYDRLVRKPGDAKKAEQVLEFRQQSRDNCRIRTLSPTDRSSFRYRWNEVQARFFDDPPDAVKLADSLVIDVMQASGYPVAEVEQQAAKLSVDHPVVIENYCKAHEIARRHSRGQASTEDLGSAMVHYGSLFQELLDAPQIHKKGA
jgi:hypothetical protein